MFKSVIKEILIMLLLCVAIVLILGVIFYNYIPTNKAIPNKLAAYTTPENVKTEIEEEVEAAEKEEITYQIDGTDLKLYKGLITKQTFIVGLIWSIISCILLYALGDSSMVLCDKEVVYIPFISLWSVR